MSRAPGDLDADYAAAGFGGSLPWGQRPTLVIVDMAMAYFEPSSPLYAGVEATLAPNIALAAAARARGAPVVFTRVEYAAGLSGRDGGLFYRKVKALACFDAGNPLGDFHPDLRPQPGDLVLTKQYPSAFFGTPLASTLTAAGCDTVIITGLSTSGCVRATALDALCHGFVPVVVEDAVGDRAEAVHRANLFDLQAKYADVVPSARVLAYLA
jgi:maleamate amidohydrolase